MSWGNHNLADAPFVDTSDNQEEGIAVHAGFPNPGADRRGAPLSLDKLLIKHPISTFFFRIRGHQWHDRGIFDGDVAVIDRALHPQENDLVIWWSEQGEMYLEAYRTAAQQNIWGVVASVIHPIRGVRLDNEE